MRADRLISLLLLLQNRGLMTSFELADELGVSQRTIYRDLEALSLSGIPVYAQKGPGGGCALLDSYRSTLIGLTDEEIRALWMVSLPGPLGDLGLAGALRDAVLKVTSARGGAPEKGGLNVYLDWTAWKPSTGTTPFLQPLYQGVLQRRKAWLTIRLERGDRVERVYDPYGLVAKTGAWYLVASRDGMLYTIPCTQLEDVHLLEENFERPTAFVLEQYWSEWRNSIETNRPYYPVLAGVSPELVPHLPKFFGADIHERIRSAKRCEATGWLELELPFETLEEARMRILAFGRAIEVLAPLPLRLSVADFARQIVDLYGEPL